MVSLKPSYFVPPSFFEVIGKSSLKENYIFSCEKCFCNQIGEAISLEPIYDLTLEVNILVHYLPLTRYAKKMTGENRKMLMLVLALKPASLLQISHK